MLELRRVSLDERHNYVGLETVKVLLNEDIYRDWTKVECPEDRALAFYLDLELITLWACERNSWIEQNCQGIWHTSNSNTYFFRNPKDAMLYKLSGL